MDSRVGARDGDPSPRALPQLLRRDGCRLAALPCAKLRPQSLFLLPQLGRELLAKVLGLEDWPNLDLGLATHRVGTALDPLDRLVERLYLPDPVAGDQFLRLHKGTVD